MNLLLLLPLAIPFGCLALLSLLAFLGVLSAPSGPGSTWPGEVRGMVPPPATPGVKIGSRDLRGRG
jgi:hypothetical protein